MESQGLPSAQNPVEAQSEQFDTPAPQEAAAIAPEETEVETTQETTVPMATENETPAAVNPYAGKTQEELIALLAEMLEKRPVQQLRGDVEAVKIAFYKAGRAEIEAQRTAFIENGGAAEDFKPADSGESPLANCPDFLHVEIDGVKGIRETNTMPQGAGSCWYYLRYIDPKNDEMIGDPKLLEHWLPVDLYVGGAEHAVLHLLYSRFWHKVLYDQGILPTPEPFKKLFHQGMILGENGEKMSKSRGNVVNPDDIVADYGADTLRTYEMFIGAFELSAGWSEDGVKGCRRFLERVWKLQDILTEDMGYSKDMEIKMHQTIKKVSNDFESLKYNTAIAAMMALVNEFYKKNTVTKGEFKTLITLLNPVAPHITEELWQRTGFDGRVYQTAWPEFEEAKTVESTVEIAVQINGKTRATLDIGKDDPKEEVFAKAKEVIADKLTGTIVKEIYVPGRIVNIVQK